MQNLLLSQVDKEEILTHNSFERLTGMEIFTGFLGNYLNYFNRARFFNRGNSNARYQLMFTFNQIFEYVNFRNIHSNNSIFHSY